MRPMSEAEAREDEARTASIVKACDDYRAIRLANDAYDERRAAEGSVDAQRRIARRKGETCKRC